MMAGGSYLDLIPLFDVSKSHLYRVFHEFTNWIISLYEFPLPRWLQEGKWETLTKAAEHFSESTDGIYYGPFGALGGLAIQIASPTLQEVSDPGNYYCRKGFYALNVQAICNHSKCFLWMNLLNKGSSHGSAAFTGSQLYQLLEEKAEELCKRGIFIVGDSAYGLTPFLIVPYDSADVKNDRTLSLDSFNFHLSSCRIFIECAFGELIMRWGIFWRTLLFDLKKATRIIQAAMLLHNFIIDNDREDERYYQEFTVPNDRTQQELLRITGKIPRPLVSDNNERSVGGRHSREEQYHKEKGKTIRHRLTVKLAINDLKRPLQYDMHYNDLGHIYMTS